jgi:copper chaperone CopZ
VTAVTKAVKGVDPDATVNVDIANEAVAIESTADAGSLASALAAAGYPAEKRAA